MGKIIGIDLGTTNSVCGIMEGGEARIVVSEEGGRVTPTVVGFSKDGSRFVGDIAKRQLLINPEATIHSIKRFIGKSFDEVEEQIPLVHYSVVPNDKNMASVQVNDKIITTQEISAFVLQKIKRAAENYLGEPVSEAVITVPAYFTDSQRQATKDAGTIAGLDVLRVINEPTAAALAYVHQRKDSARIAVYDWGGGTFDISILKVSEDIAEVLSTRGNNVLGGADVDTALVHWMVGLFKEETGIDVSTDNIVMQRLRDAAERAKIELTSTTSTQIHLPFLVSDESGPKHLQASLTRDNFESLAKHLFVETIEECKEAMKDANIETGDIDEVIMVGGSSRIPMVQTMVGELFGKPLNKSFHPDEVVAIGAAIQGSILGGDTKAVTLLDVTNFSLGIKVEGDRMAVLIPKNTTIPTETTRLVSTVQDDQETVKIHILQGESDSAGENVSLGEFELHNIPAGPRGGPRIEVAFSIDTSGIVTVTAKDTRTGVSDQILIESPIGMSERELSDMQSSIDPNAAEGDELGDDLSDDLSIQISSVEAKMLIKGDALDPAIRQSIENTLATAKKVLESGTSDERQSSIDSLKDHAGLFPS